MDIAIEKIGYLAGVITFIIFFVHLDKKIQKYYANEFIGGNIIQHIPILLNPQKYFKKKYIKEGYSMFLMRDLVSVTIVFLIALLIGLIQI